MMMQSSNFDVDLSGRVALVTGASSGLGARFATILAANGASVVLAARRLQMLEQVRSEIEADGGKAICVALDVADQASTQRAYSAAEDAFGTVDTVIANAGMNVEGHALDIDADVVDRILDVNVRGVFLTVREAARRLIAVPADRRKQGRIVIISSITAQAVSPGIALYSASKAAVLQLGRVLAREWINKGINLNVLCPGYIETDINSNWFATESGQKHIQRWPRKRLMDAHALDASLLYLASDASAFVTGSVTTIDDGQSL